MGKYFLTTKETLNYIYEVEADSAESAIEIFKENEGYCHVHESKIISAEIVSVSKCEDGMHCDHCGAALTEETRNYASTKNGKKFYFCNRCLEQSFTNEEWDRLIDLLSRI